MFLYDEGYLDATSCIEVLRLQSRRTPPLGRLVVKEKLLGMAQLSQLLRRQLESGMPLGQLAVSEGLLSEPQLQRLVERQRAETPGSLALVGELRLLSPERLQEAHARFLATLS